VEKGENTKISKLSTDGIFSAPHANLIANERANTAKDYTALSTTRAALRQW
jgi:hypothetical protein